MEITTVKIENPEGLNFVLGQSHFIKTVEDIYEIMVTTVPMAKFALAFCEASDKCLIRHAGTDDALLELAKKYEFTLSLGDGFRPGCIADATDSPQIHELITLGECVKRARAAGVQTMVEGPGHVPLHQIEANVRLEKTCTIPCSCSLMLSPFCSIFFWGTIK